MTGLWLSRAMEALWLLTVGLVPILFAPPDFMVFVDVPKVVLLRSLTGLMILLWIIEWALKSVQVEASTSSSTFTTTPNADAEAETGGPGRGMGLWTRFRRWTREEPSRWTLVAATLFLAANVISTLLSPALSISLWGNNPGRDGYGLYNMASYFVLFVVIATHLRTRPQLWRLLGVIVASATIVSIYGILQHYGADPFLEGSAAHLPSTFGNRLFAASFMVTALPISLGVGLALSYILSRSNRYKLWINAGWVALVVVQLMAIMFTLSRGPWIALAAGSLVWLAMVGVIAGRRTFIRAFLALSVSVAVALILTVTVVPALSGSPGESDRDALFGRAASVSTEVTSGGISGRLSIWKRSADIIMERPWFDAEDRGPVLVRHLVGYGPDLFLYALPLRWDADALEPVNASAHN